MVALAPRTATAQAAVNLRDHFAQLSVLLLETRHYWHPVPFKERHPRWQDDNPSLSALIRDLSETDVASLEADRATLRKLLAHCIPQLETLQVLLAAVPALPAQIPEARIRDAQRDIPGRKLQQITAFTRCLSPSTRPFLDWCGGKGHLARSLSLHHQQPVTCLEWNPTLCADGQQLANRLALPVTLVPCDVLKNVDHLMTQNHYGVALHACGVLHRRLLEKAVEHCLPQLALSPCCYNLEPELDTPESPYRPLSEAGNHSALALNNEDIRLALQETRHAGAREIRAREQSRSWRLGFDLLQRDIRQNDDYLPVPSLPGKVLQGSFRDFCLHVATLKNMALPSALDFFGYEEAGAKRLREVNRLDLVRHAFGRFIEMWLVLDRALFLEEAGYQVNVGFFCDEHLTGRNWLIRGLRT